MRDCKHGQLARTCGICYLEAERDRLKAEFYKMQETAWLNERDRNTWKAKAYKLAEALEKFADYDKKGFKKDCDFHLRHDEHGWAKAALEGSK